MQLNDKDIEEKVILIGEKIFELFKENNYDPSVCVTAMITCIYGIVHQFHRNPRQILIDISEDFLNMSQNHFMQTNDKEDVMKKD